MPRDNLKSLLQISNDVQLELLWYFLQSDDRCVKANSGTEKLSKTSYHPECDMMVEQVNAKEYKSMQCIQVNAKEDSCYSLVDSKSPTEANLIPATFSAPTSLED